MESKSSRAEEGERRNMYLVLVNILQPIKDEVFVGLRQVSPIHELVTPLLFIVCTLASTAAAITASAAAAASATAGGGGRRSR